MIKRQAVGTVAVLAENTQLALLSFVDSLVPNVREQQIAAAAINGALGQSEAGGDLFQLLIRVDGQGHQDPSPLAYQLLTGAL